MIEIPSREGRAVALALLLPLTMAACGERGPQTAFSGEGALDYVRQQLAFGPRVPGTAAHERAGDWIAAQMRPRADTVIEQRWTHRAANGDTLPMRNILARYRTSAPERVLYLTHWDTRPTSDGEQDPARRALPMPGANDGASGVALFIALGDVLHKTPPGVGVDLLFVDGEDYGDFTTGTDILIGSKYFATHLPDSTYRPMYGVLWDMIGDADLQIYREPNSVQRAREVVEHVWDVAEDLHYSHYFRSNSGQALLDDHIPLLDAGIHVIDVIDYDYPARGKRSYHHTSDDTIDKLSAHSLQVVGDVAATLVK